MFRGGGGGGVTKLLELQQFSEEFTSILHRVHGNPEKCGAIVATLVNFVNTL